LKKLKTKEAQNGTFVANYDCAIYSVSITNTNEGLYVLLITYWSSEPSINRTYNFTFLYDTTPSTLSRYYYQTDYPSSFSLYFQCTDNSVQFYQSSGSTLNKCSFFYDVLCRETHMVCPGRSRPKLLSHPVHHRDGRGQASLQSALCRHCRLLRHPGLHPKSTLLLRP
jgi:hypothetical protein